MSGPANGPAPRPGRPAAAKTTGRAGSGTSGTGRSRTGSWLRRALTYGLVIGMVVVLMASAILYFAYRRTVIPTPNQAFQAQATYVYYSNGSARLGQYADQNRESVPLAQIPQAMQDAAIAAEDRTFYSNKGIDPKGIVRAAFSNAQGNATQGASTITQQYVKLLYLSQQRTLKRKVKEAFISLKIQQEQSKQEILQGYLNTVYFGRGAYGVQAAARAFFGVSAKQLNIRQSAMLAAVVNSPSYLSPDRSDASREALLTRYRYVLSGMVAMGSISAERADALVGRLPRFVPSSSGNQFDGQNGFALSMVKTELERLGFAEKDIESGGLRVTTTLTRGAMDAAAGSVAQEQPKGLKGLHTAVASVDVKTGGLLGFFAGQDYLKSQINWAVAGGSPGSSFKAFALAAGLKDGFSLKDTFDGNSPFTLDNGDTIQNEGEGTGENLGSAISLLTATEQSVNTAYVDMTTSMEDGPQKVKAMALRLGIPAGRTTFGRTAGLQAVPSIALGSATVSPMDMASAYATIADRGVHHDLFLIKRVSRASDGKVLYQAPKTEKRVLDEDIADDTSYALQEVVQNGTGRAALDLGRPAAGKTGTATNGDGDVSSSWFVGFTPQVATAVMYVRGKGNGALNGFLPTYFGAVYPAQTWTAAMSALLDGTDEADFPPPAYVDGTAPSTGHAPYTPPPAPKPQPKKPGKRPTRAPTTAAPAPAPAPAPSAPPAPAPAPASPSPPADPGSTDCPLVGCG